MLYRLMRRPVLANGNAVVRKYKDGAQAHQCSHTYCRTHKIGKYKEGAAKRNEAAMQRNTVQCFAHSMFAHAKMNISAGSVIFGIAEEAAWKVSAALRRLLHGWKCLRYH